jgi:acyl carrier protein
MTPHQEALAAEIARLAREELHLEVDGGPDDELAARLDSMALLALVTAVEDRFRVILSEEDAIATRTLADLARLVERKQAARPPGPGGA